VSEQGTGGRAASGARRSLQAASFIVCMVGMQLRRNNEKSAGPMQRLAWRYCPVCDYCLGGDGATLQSARCPECGSDLADFSGLIESLIQSDDTSNVRKIILIMIITLLSAIAAPLALVLYGLAHDSVIVTTLTLALVLLLPMAGAVRFRHMAGVMIPKGDSYAFDAFAILGGALLVSIFAVTGKYWYNGHTFTAFGWLYSYYLLVYAGMLAIGPFVVFELEFVTRAMYFQEEPVRIGTLSLIACLVLMLLVGLFSLFSLFLLWLLLPVPILLVVISVITHWQGIRRLFVVAFIRN